MTARILQCLDLCEASGLFDGDEITRARSHIDRFGFSVVREWIGISVHPASAMRTSKPTVRVHLIGARDPLSPGVAESMAATLSRVATLARECDRVMGGGE